jgi:long-subunit acyl-CoA synthetase (AMP-forming)
MNSIDPLAILHQDEVRTHAIFTYIRSVPIENAIQLRGVAAICVLGANRSAPFVLLVPSPELRQELADEKQSDFITATIAQKLRLLNASLDPHERLSHAVLVDDEWTSANGLLTPTLKIVRSAIENRYDALAAERAGRNIPI